MSQQYTSYLPPTATRNNDKQLLLQQQYTDFNVSPSSQQQLVMSARSTEDINSQQQQTHIMLNNLSKPKRNQVKNACVNCQKACKKCDEGRPCQRCIKYNLAETCQDSVRKERKKGVKRGPYKQTERSGTRKRKEKKVPNSNELKNINMCSSQQQQQQQQQHQWPVDVKILEQQSINMSQQNSSVSPKNGKKCEMKHVTQQQPLSSYQKDMSKYIANLQQRQFIPPNSNNNTAMMYNNEDNVQFNYSNTTIPSPLSNHNGSNNLNTMSNNNNTGVPSMPHGQDIDTMYSIYIQNNLQQLHNSNNVSVYGTPTGSPILLPSQTQELGTLDFVNSTPWETHQATNLHHKFVNNDNNANWFYS